MYRPRQISLLCYRLCIWITEEEEEQEQQQEKQEQVEQEEEEQQQKEQQEQKEENKKQTQRVVKTSRVARTLSMHAQAINPLHSLSPSPHQVHFSRQANQRPQ